MFIPKRTISPSPRRRCGSAVWWPCRRRRCTVSAPTVLTPRRSRISTRSRAVRRSSRSRSWWRVRRKSKSTPSISPRRRSSLPRGSGRDRSRSCLKRKRTLSRPSSGPGKTPSVCAARRTGSRSRCSSARGCRSPDLRQIPPARPAPRQRSRCSPTLTGGSKA